MKVADKLVDELVGYGIEHVFGVPGGQTLPLYDAIERRAGEIEHVLVRDERSGVYAADGYARATGRVGVCDATVGPGASNLVSGLVEAYSSSVPVLAIVADIPRDWEHRRKLGSASQGFDQRGFLEACVRWYGRVEVPESLPDVLHACLRIATADRPGPVVLEIPDDVFRADLPDTPTVASPDWAAFPRLRSGPDHHAVAAAADRLVGSDRPMVVAGGGALQAGAEAPLRDLIDHLECPVATTLTGKGVLPETHPLCVGVCGSFGIPVANEVLARSDCVVFIGCKTGQMTTLGWRVPSSDTPVVHIDIDAEEIGRNYRDTIGIWADAYDGTKRLAEAVRERPVEYAWNLDTIRDRVGAWWDGPVEFASPPKEGVVKPQRIVRVMQDVMADDDVIVSDASLASGWVGAHWKAVTPGKFSYAPRGLAGIGWGLPATIGVHTGLSNAQHAGRVVGLAGDGGWGYSMAEVETAARAALPIVCVILNNSSLAWIKHSGHNKGIDATTAAEFTRVSYADAARALGAQTERVDTIDEFETAFETALADLNGHPWVIEAVTCEIESPIQQPPDTEHAY